jgi:DNA-binding NtrC family response regulator
MKTILVVDDELVCLQQVEEILGRMGYNVIAKANGRSALTVISDGTPVDLVITDYCMPEMDGLEFVNALRRTDPALPLIMVTGHSDIESYVKARSLGVFEYLNKPVAAKELGRVVRKVLELSDLDRGNPMALNPNKNTIDQPKNDS